MKPSWLLLLVAAAPSPGRASQWVIESVTGSSPGSRWGGTMTLLPGSSPPQTLVCGGTNPAGDYIGACYLLNSSAWVSSQLLGSGVFLPRSDHTAVIWGDLLVAYGGNVSGGDLSLRTAPAVYSLSNRSHVLAPVITGEVPPARWGHAAVKLGGSTWVVFGGVGDESMDDLDDVAVLDLGDGATPVLAWRPVAIDGTIPAARHYHAAAAYDAKTAFVTGGTAVSGEVYADTFMLSCLSPAAAACTWKVVPAVRGVPQYGHLAAMASTTLVTYGGWVPSSEPGGRVRTLQCDAPSPVWADNVPTGAWLGTPFRASGAVLDAASSAEDFELLVFGGRSVDINIISPPLVALLQQRSPPGKAAFDMVPVIVVVSILLGAVIAVAMYFVWRYGVARAAAAAAAEDGGDGTSPSAVALLSQPPLSSSKGGGFSGGSDGGGPYSYGGRSPQQPLAVPGTDDDPDALGAAPVGDSSSDSDDGLLFS